MNIIILTCLLCIQTLIPTDNSEELFENASSTKTTKVYFLEKPSIKISIACAFSLSAHYILEFISTYAHEHGHGMASGTNYAVEMIPNNNILQPWHGVCRAQSAVFNQFIFTLAGPLAGISTTLIQLSLLNALSNFIDSKSSNATRIKSPIHFFSNARKTGKKIGAAISSKQSFSDAFSKTSILSLTTNILLHLRIGRIVGECIYGLLPYHHKSQLATDVGGGDGEKIWRMILGKTCPTFCGNLAYMTLAVIAIPYLIGILEALYEKKYPNEKFDQEDTRKLIIQCLEPFSQ